MSIRVLDQAIERATGESVEELRLRTIEETRRIAEERTGRAMRFMSAFPFIGRGNVLRDRVISHDDVEAVLDRALRE